MQISSALQFAPQCIAMGIAVHWHSIAMHWNAHCSPAGSLCADAARAPRGKSSERSGAVRPCRNLLRPRSCRPHDERGAHNALTTSGFVPESLASILMSGVRRDKARRRARISPPVSWQVVSPRRPPAAGDGLTSHTTRQTCTTSRKPPHWRAVMAGRAGALPSCSSSGSRPPYGPP